MWHRLTRCDFLCVAVCCCALSCFVCRSCADSFCYVAKTNKRVQLSCNCHAWKLHLSFRFSMHPLIFQNHTFVQKHVLPPIVYDIHAHNTGSTHALHRLHSLHRSSIRNSTPAQSELSTGSTGAQQMHNTNSTQARQALNGGSTRFQRGLNRRSTRTQYDINTSSTVSQQWLNTSSTRAQQSLSTSTTRTQQAPNRPQQAINTNSTRA